MSGAILSHPFMPSWHTAGLYFYHTYKSMTSHKDGYLFVVEYFMQYHFIICLDKNFRHKSPEPLFKMATSNLQNPFLAKHTNVQKIPHFLDKNFLEFTKPCMFMHLLFMNIK